MSRVDSLSAAECSEWEGRGSDGEVKSQTLRLTADIVQKTVGQSDTMDGNPDINERVCERESDHACPREEG